MREDGEVRERREDGGADAHGEDGAGRGLAVRGEVHAGNGADADDVDGGEGLGDGAAVLEHGAEREDDGDEEEGERGAGDALDGDGDGEGGVEDLVQRAAGAGDGDEGEVDGEQLGAVGELVVEQGLGQRLVPHGVVREHVGAVLGEREPDPAVERRGEREGHDAEHAVDLGLRGEREKGAQRRHGRGCGGVGGGRVRECRHAEVDEDDGGRPVEVRDVLVPEVDGVERDGQKEAVEGDGTARRVAAHEGGEAAAVAPVGGALVADVGDGGEGLQDLAAEADEQEKQNDDGGERLVELQLHVCGRGNV